MPHLQLSGTYWGFEITDWNMELLLAETLLDKSFYETLSTRKSFGLGTDASKKQEEKNEKERKTE
jgi:hypothetical protein